MSMPEVPLVLPLDTHNQRLVDNVHPAGWANPAPAAHYHLVVLGAGTAGIAAAIGAADLGARVAIVERRLLGGDRLNCGSVPAKAVLRAARAFREARRAGDFGVRATLEGGDFAAAMESMRRTRAELSDAGAAWRLRELGIDVFLGEGRFAGPEILEVGGVPLAFRRALISTGARPAIPGLPGLGEVGFLTTESVFSLTDLPRRLAVLGGGPAGCELAQAFARFGSQVTLMVRGSRLLPREEEESARLVQRALEVDGVRVVAQCRLLGVQRPQRSKVVQFELEGHHHQLPVDEILVTAGRSANVQNLGLEVAGVAFSPRGVVVDERLQTTNPRIFACGEVTGAGGLAHVAEAQAKIALQNALFGARKKTGTLLVPRCTHTSPEIAQVGLQAEELSRRGLTFATLTVPLQANDRARIDDAAEGSLRLHYRKGSDRILGATLVSEHAGETIAELVVAIQHGIGLAALAETLHPYPTQAEVVQRAAEAWRQTKLTKWNRRLLALRFRRQDKQERRRSAKAQGAAVSGTASRSGASESSPTP
jgi:pyruvate/2-oxoglutarate dehydrogenase complex dihydrolipoamide dehydrogenase (E3) component